MQGNEGSPEDLHKVGQGTGKVATDSFVNPGTPANPLVGMDDRKSGTISGGTGKLKDHMNAGGK